MTELQKIVVGIRSSNLSQSQTNLLIQEVLSSDPSLKKDLFDNRNFRFGEIKTKEDYALWLSFARNNIHIAGINKYYSSWRKNNNSLSSNLILKFVNGFKVYYKYEKKNIFLSLLFTARLAIYYVNKKCMQIINLNK